MKQVVILILAAGTSTRMRGGDKLLEMVDDETLLRRQAKAALGTGKRVLVMVSEDHPKRSLALAGLDVETVPVNDAQTGMSASIRAGMRLASAEAGVMILPADMPEIDEDDLQSILRGVADHPDEILRGSTQNGVPGHPVAFPKRLFADLMRIQGDQGARDVLQGEAAVLIPLPDDHAITDLDTPEDWAAWRKRNS